VHFWQKISNALSQTPTAKYIKSSIRSNPRPDSFCRQIKLSGQKMKRERNSIDRLSIAKECVDREIRDANVYYKLLFELINGLLENKNFYKNFDKLFFYIREALETKYVFALAKIFASSKEESLWRLIVEVKKIPDVDFYLKLKREQGYMQGQIKNERLIFFNSYNSYIIEINKIKSKISFLRNTQRAHNYPLWSKKEKITWQQTKDWLSFAEKVFSNSVEAICESSPSPGSFVPDDFSTDIRYLVSVIKTINLK